MQENNTQGDLQDFIRQYVGFYPERGFTENGMVPYIRRDLATWELDPNFMPDFFHLHDRFEEANETYQEFQQRYSPLEGPINGAEIESLLSLLENIDLGDIEGLFTPLDQHDRFCYYHLVPREVQQTYEQRWRQLLLDNTNDQEVTEHGIIDPMPLEGQGDRDFLMETWRTHASGNNFFRYLWDIIYGTERILERNSEREGADVTRFEGAIAREITDDDRCDEGRVYTLFEEDAENTLRQMYSEDQFRIQTYFPSLANFRRMLPEEIDPNEMFDGGRGFVRPNELGNAILNIRLNSREHFR